jgi:hypothetical protein
MLFTLGRYGLLYSIMYGRQASTPHLKASIINGAARFEKSKTIAVTPRIMFT